MAATATHSRLELLGAGSVSCAHARRDVKSRRNQSLNRAAATSRYGCHGRGILVASRAVGTVRSFGKTVLPIDEAFALIAIEPAFWIGTR
jgi:TnpA family transposase